MVVGVNNIFGGLAAHEPGHRFPRLFMRLRGKLAQVVGAAVHVGVLRFIIIPGGIQDG